MAAIDIIRANYTSLKGKKREKEAEGRERIAREMVALQAEFDALVFRAKAEGSSITAIAKEMDVSRTLIYQILARAVVLDAVEPLITNPMAEFAVWDEDLWAFRCRWAETGETHSLGATHGSPSFEGADGTKVYPSPEWWAWFTPMEPEMKVWVASQDKGERP